MATLKIQVSLDCFTQEHKQAAQTEANPTETATQKESLTALNSFNNLFSLETQDLGSSQMSLDSPDSQHILL